MAAFSITATDAHRVSSLTYTDSYADIIVIVREFRAMNDYADNTHNPAVIDVSRLDYGASTTAMFWSAKEGFFGPAKLAALRMAA